MKRKEYNLLVENWRCFVNEAIAPGSQFMPKDWSSFELALKDFRRKMTKWDPNSGGTGMAGNKVYGSLWNAFWPSFQTNDVDANNCVEKFFNSLKTVYNSDDNKLLFDKAFQKLISSSGNRADFVSLPVGMIFDDFMNNMRGESQGYCWNSDEEGIEIFKAFQDKYKDLMSKGFDSETGECLYLKTT